MREKQIPRIADMSDDGSKPVRNRFRKIEVRMWGDE